MPQRHFIATGHLHTLHTSTVLYQPFPENADDMPRLISALCTEWRNFGIAGVRIVSPELGVADSI